MGRGDWILLVGAVEACVAGGFERVCAPHAGVGCVWGRVGRGWGCLTHQGGDSPVDPVPLTTPQVPPCLTWSAAFCGVWHGVWVWRPTRWWQTWRRAAWRSGGGRRRCARGRVCACVRQTGHIDHCGSWGSTSVTVLCSARWSYLESVDQPFSPLLSPTQALPCLTAMPPAYMLPLLRACVCRPPPTAPCRT